MSESAMASPVRETGLEHLVGELGEDRSALRDALVAGPGGPVVVDPALLGGVLRVVAGEDAIIAGLAAAGHVDRRRRVFTGAVTVAAVLGLCLFRGESQDLVIARVLADMPRVRVEGRPSGAALSKARVRLADDAMRVVFERSATAMPEPGVECYAFDLLVTAFDGTVFDLAATAEMDAGFATPSGGRFPQARVVTLAVCGLRWVLAARVGSSATSEQALVDQMADCLAPGTLNLADRNFFSMDRWVRFQATGAQLAWRVKNGLKSLPATMVAVLSDGSSRVRLSESDAMLAYRRKKTGDPGLRRLPDTIARLVEFTLQVRDEAGRVRTSRFRILTTLLDPGRYPAGRIAEIYGERWQIELIFARVKIALRGSSTRLRGQSPDLAVQEIWGLLIVYNALVTLAVAAALTLGVGPDEISFTAVLALTRASLDHDTPCRNCGCRPSDIVDPLTVLTATIATQPRNRTDRQRTAPRTKKQRQTERTRDVEYLITVVPSTLSRNDETALS
ncbi:MAG: IS4 family transposase [Dactylosporangium sp.]|nr:IS4 family transposase [Dactylosporangium sp.]NNJ60999.1 IS4 family transposase [Dactylosporangium sp.]